MSFNPGERVKYKFMDRGIGDPSEYHGVIVEVIPTYMVRWDDGTEETHDEIDLEHDDNETFYPEDSEDIR